MPRLAEVVALGLVQGPEWGWGDGRVLGSVACGCLLLPACALRCKD